MASAPGPAWGQWTGGPTGPIYYNSSGAKVGISTTAPATKLHMVTAAGNSYRFVSLGGIYFNTAAAKGGNSTSAPSTNLNMVTAAGNSYLFVSLGGIYFNTAITGATGTNTRLIIDTSGNVGIGTTSPQHLLHVAGIIGAQEV